MKAVFAVMNTTLTVVKYSSHLLVTNYCEDRFHIQFFICSSHNYVILLCALSLKSDIVFLIFGIAADPD